MVQGGNIQKEYGWRPGGQWSTNPLFMKQNGEYYFYLNDHLGTPQKLTSVSGAVVWSATYTAFGLASVNAASSITNNLRFPGQYFDYETGLHYNWHRYYNPITGRYNQIDPIGFEGDFNLYEYVFSNPLYYIDPTGEFGILGAGIAFIIEISIQLALNGGRIDCIDWSDVALSTFFGAIAPGALSSIKKGFKFGKFAYKSHKKIKTAKRAKYVRRLTQNRNSQLKNIGNEIVNQALWQGFKKSSKKLSNMPDNKECPEDEPCTN